MSVRVEQWGPGAASKDDRLSSIHCVIVPGDEVPKGKARRLQLNLETLCLDADGVIELDRWCVLTRMSDERGFEVRFRTKADADAFLPLAEWALRSVR